MPPLSKPGTLSGSEFLDQPPPSPALEQGMGPGTPLPTEAVQGFAPPPMGAGQLPPDVLTGMMKTATQMAQDLDAFAQMAPDIAPRWAAVKEALSIAMSELLMAGSGPISPTATGPGFPGGGIDRGGLPLASGGS